MIKQLLVASLLSTTFLAQTIQASEVWPDLPVGIKNGISAQVDQTLFVGLGSAAQALYALDLKAIDKGWQKMANFPGPATSGAPSAAVNGNIYVFSGSGKTSKEAVSPVIFDSIYRYNVAANQWSKVNSKAPVGLLGASALALKDGNIALVGGYNKALFDKYLFDVITTDKKTQEDKWNEIVDTYMSMQPLEYQWNKAVYKFNPNNDKWTIAGTTPYLPNTGAAVVKTKTDNYLLINGEIKPGLRTPKVKTLSFNNKEINWQENTQIPALKGDELQEGLAGAYAGKSGNAILVAGGANFKGARSQSIAGNWFAHKGAKKRWNQDVFALIANGWSQVGSLNQGLAYGAYFNVNDGLLIVGGENQQREAQNKVFLLNWDGEKVSTVQ